MRVGRREREVRREAVAVDVPRHVRARRARVPPQESGVDSIFLRRLLLGAEERRGQREQPRDRLKRLLARNTAERRGETAGGVGELRRVEQARRAAPKPILVGEGGEAADGPLLKVKRTILPEEDEDGDADEAAGGVGGAASGAAAPVPRKLKIRKGGTVAGGRRTVFDDDGLPIVPIE